LNVPDGPEDVPDRPAAADADADPDLETLLARLEIEVDPFALCEVRGGGRLAMGAEATATLHFVLAGRGRLEVAGAGGLVIEAGSLVVVPRAAAHRLVAAQSGTPSLPRCAPLSGDWQRLRAGSGEAGVLLACGRVLATLQHGRGLFDFLERPIIETLPARDPLRRTVEDLLAELAQPRPGTRRLARSMMEQALIHLLRRHCPDGVCRAPWLKALWDERAGRAVAAMLDRPEAAHSLQSLADLAGMSRSRFAARFTSLFGEAPIAFLRRVRLDRARRQLETEDVPIKTLARRVGFESRSYFSRAFKDQFGMSPEEARRQAMNPRPGSRPRG